MSTEAARTLMKFMEGSESVKKEQPFFHHSCDAKIILLTIQNCVQYDVQCIVQ